MGVVDVAAEDGWIVGGGVVITAVVCVTGVVDVAAEDGWMVVVVGISGGPMSCTHSAVDRACTHWANALDRFCSFVGVGVAVVTTVGAVAMVVISGGPISCTHSAVDRACTHMSNAFVRVGVDGGVMEVVDVVGVGGGVDFLAVLLFPMRQ